jgi:hypothetical protein
MHFSRKIAVGSALALALVAAPVSAFALTSGSTGVTYTACVKSNVIQHLYQGSHSCPSGQTAFSWNQVGQQGPPGQKGATGAKGPQGPAGPATLSVTAVTTLSNRPDSGANGNWATDQMTRTATVTRHDQVASTDCGSSATSCWFYTATISDVGSFQTIPGAFTPNQECTEPNNTSCNGLTISGTVSGSINGGGTMEFYANSSNPSASSVPTTVKGDGDDTSTWYTLFFPAATQFQLTTNSNAPFTAWSWSYNAPGTCENWVDAYNNGDGDGPYSPDGNIAGINECTG